MAIAQSTYGLAFPIGLVGQIINGETSNRISRTVETAGGLPFGYPAYRGSDDHGCVVGAAFAATGAGSEAATGNVGTSTITDAPAVATPAKQGRYAVVQLTTGATGELGIYDPNGVLVGNGVVGTEFTVDGITATVTGGGTPTAGDTFYVDVEYTANADFLGLAMLDHVVPAVAASGTPDEYPENYTAALMTKGQMVVTAGATVAQGDDVYWNPANGRYTNTTTHVRIPGAVFDQAGTDGNLTVVSLKTRT